MLTKLLGQFIEQLLYCSRFFMHYFGKLPNRQLDIQS